MTKTMVSALHKELEYKVEKLKYKAVGGQKHFFALRASVWSTNKEEGGGHPGPLPWIRHWNKHDSDRSRR